MHTDNKNAATKIKSQRSQQINYSMIPRIMQEKNRWVGHVDKIPMNPYNGRRAKSSNPNTWSDLRTAILAVKKHNFDGIGFQL
ncbi:MAG: hypothetical protein FWC41_02560 [Firmicutes bacterium]|nr:hypothetical protein [Bacillota bacterium]